MKKLLALVLALVMVMGLATVGANAAFADAESIDHDEAVEVLNSLGVIGGKENNNFDPSGNVKRSEMAKMIAIILLGADVNDSAFTGASSKLTDINGHWAEGFIKYCVAQKIVGGYEDSTFRPDNNVTTAEAAKMLLTALGYNAEVQEYTGADWSINVIRDASGKKMFEDLGSMAANKPITRDEAAQMIYNTVQRGMIVKSASQERTNSGEIRDSYTDTDQWGNAPITLLGETFDGMVRTGYLQGWTFDNNKKVWTYAFDAGVNANNGLFGGDGIAAKNAISTSYTNGSANNYNTVSLDSKTNYTDLFGQKVKVVYNIEKSDVVYGVFSAAKVLAEAAVGQISDVNATNNTAKIAGTSIKFEDVDGNDSVYYNLTNAATVGASAAMGGIAASFGAYAAFDIDDLKDETKAFTFKVIDNDDNDKADAVIVTPLYLDKILFVGSDTFTASGTVASNKLEDNYLYEGFAKDDFAWYTHAIYSPVVNGGVMTKAEVKTGKVDGIRSGATAAADEYQIDGTWYKRGDLTGSGLTINSGAALELGDTVEYVALGTKLFYAKVTDAAATGKDVVLYITGDQDGTLANVNTTSYKAKLLFSDGTKKTVGIAKIDGADAAWTNTTTGNVATSSGHIFTYRINSDGDYELTSVGAGNLAGYKAYAGTLSYANKKVGTYELADDAIVFVYDGAINVAAAGNGGKIYTGKEIKSSYPTTIGTAIGANAETLTKAVNGFTYAQLAAIPTNGGLNALKGNNYAYLTGNAYKTQEGDDFYVNYKMWNGTAEVDVKQKANSNADANALVDVMKKGATISYDATSTDGVIKSVNRLNVETGVVTGWDEVGQKKIAISPKVGTPISSEVTSDTTVLYINSKDVKGSASGTIRLASETSGDDTLTAADMANVRYLYNTGADHIELLIVDINNEMKNGASTTYATLAGVSAASFQTALNSGDVTITTTVTGGETAFTAGFTVPEGTTLTIDDGTAAPTSVTLADAAYVVKGKLVMDGDLTANALASGDLDIDGGYVEVGGDITLGGTNAIKNTSDGTLKVKDFTDETHLVTAKVANIIITGDTDKLDGACATHAAVKTLTFEDDYTIGGTFTTSATATTINVASGKTLTVTRLTDGTNGVTLDGDFAISTVDAANKVTVASGSTLAIDTALTAPAKLTNNGTVSIDYAIADGATLTGGEYVVTVAPAGALNMAATTEVKFTTAIDATAVFTAVTAGSKVSFTVAPSNAAAADTVGAFFEAANSASATAAGSITLNATYVGTAAAGITNSTAAGFVKQ